MKKWLYIIALIILLFLIFATDFYFKKPYLNNFKYIFSLSSIVQENKDLKLQIEDLKNEADANQNNYSLKASSNSIIAKIFSVYPFNQKNRIYANVGSNDGTFLGQAVTVSKTIFLGQVSNVKKDQSEIVTSYDPKFTLPVKIGKEEIQGLLQGGVNPRITLIDKTKNISSSDKIIASSKDIPFGLFVGTISKVYEDETKSFLEADIVLPYQISEIKNIYFIKSNK